MSGGVKKIGLDDFLIAKGASALEALVADARSPQEETKSNGKESQSGQLVKLALQEAKLFHDGSDTPYARVRTGEAYAIFKCASRAFRRWLSHRLYVTEGKAAGAAALADALTIIEAHACFEGNQYELHNRVADHDGALWYDLTDAKRRAVKVTPDGWELVDKPPILFSRYEHQQAQAEPVTGGDIARVFDFLSPVDESTRLLLMVWMVSCFIEHTPHPVPVLHGPQGAGKSYAFRVLRRLIDPSLLLALSLPNTRNDLVQTLSHHWVALFDNVDLIQPWQSDVLCRAVTGEGCSKRQLYTDDEDYIYSFRRCIGLNGINIAATRADLLDRSILIGLERIDPGQRRSEEELEAAFAQARPHILGGILDALSRTMRIKPTVELTARPRMADFAGWGCAIAEALGFAAGDFLAAYQVNIETQNAEVLEGHPVATAIMTLMEERSEWEGEPAELLEQLEAVAEEQRINIHARLWPKASNALTRRINEVKTNLKEAGLTVERVRAADGKRRVWIFLKGPENTVGIVGTVGRAPKLLKNNDKFSDDNPTIREIPSELSSVSKSLKNNTPTIPTVPTIILGFYMAKNRRKTKTIGRR